MPKKKKTHSYVVTLAVTMDGLPRQMSESDKVAAYKSLRDMFDECLLDQTDLAFDRIPEEDGEDNE